MKKSYAYHCPCGWSRTILMGETIEDAKRIHKSLPIHKIAMEKKHGRD